MAQLIIDGRPEGLPHAPQYYLTFPLEPSSLEDIPLSKETTTTMTNSSVEAALDSMLKAGANGVVVLVCHAYSQGILLPLATGGGALAVASNMNIVDDVINAEAEAASIRKMPTKSDAELKAVLDRWEKFLNRLQPWLDHRKFHDQRSRSLLLQMAGNGSGKAGILREPAHTRVAPLHRPSAEITRQQTFQARIARLQHRQGERHDGDS